MLLRSTKLIRNKSMRSFRWAQKGEYMNLEKTLELMNAISKDVYKERVKQNAKWGVQRHHYGTWLAILGEEFGEVCEAMQKGLVSEKKSDADDLYTELIQVAAVACAIAEQVKEEQDGR